MVESIQIHVGRPISNVISSDNVELITVPESEEAVRERRFKHEVKKEVDKRLVALMQKRMQEIDAVHTKEIENEYKRGFDEGRTAGKQEELEQIEPLKEKLSNTITEVIDFRGNLIRESEATIVKMALSLAETIIGREIRSETDVVTEQVKKALEYAVGEGRLVFHVHPEDVYQFDNKESFLPEEYLERIEVLPDENVERGGCVLITNSGTIDATIEAQITELKAKILKGLESDSESDS